jgi:hypothetical protein
MSFLNQLKTQAKAAQTQQFENTQQLEAYTAGLQKACDLLLYYLTDLAHQLNVLQPATPVYSLDGKVKWPQMKATGFRVDARRKMLRNKEVFDNVSMGWDVVPQIGKPVGGLVSVNFPPDLKRVEERLALGQVKHERKEIRHPEKNVLQAIQFEYLTQTRGTVSATANHDKGQLVFRLVNTSGFDLSEMSYPAERINHDLLDELAKRVVGQDSRFV